MSVSGTQDEELEEEEYTLSHDEQEEDEQDETELLEELSDGHKICLQLTLSISPLKAVTPSIAKVSLSKQTISSSYVPLSLLSVPAPVPSNILTEPLE